MVHVPLRLLIDGDALVSNWHWLAHRSGGAACGAAVKADGYGIGAREAVKRLQHAGCRDFFVATWAEAATLMPWPSDLGLSVLHGVGPDDLEDALSSPARPVLNTPLQVARWRESGQGRPCDVMVDTGMNRLGLTPEEARSGLLDGLRVRTLMSHLACADEPDHALNERQLAVFRALRQEIPAERYSLANSAGICLGPKYGFGLTRPGLALYGGIPVLGDSAQEQGIKPVVSIEAQVVQVRDVPAGGSVGYGATYVSPVDGRIAILNIGYADGFLCRFGEFAFAKAGERMLPVVGRISMDLLAVDAAIGARNTSIRKLQPLKLAEGDWLELDYQLGEVARASGLSQYELLTMLGARFERIWR
ncbi:MAG: alanine racemase [Allosphingosinicella sp.]